MRQEIPGFSTAIQQCIRSSAGSISQGKERKFKLVRREGIKQSIHFQIIIVFVENPKKFTDKLLIHEFNKLADLRSTTKKKFYQNSVYHQPTTKKQNLYDMVQFIMIKM